VLQGKLSEEKLNILFKTLSKQHACKITVPDIAVLLCVEVVPDTLYMEESAVLCLCSTS